MFWHWQLFRVDWASSNFSFRFILSEVTGTHRWAEPPPRFELKTLTYEQCYKCVARQKKKHIRQRFSLKGMHFFLHKSGKINVNTGPDFLMRQKKLNVVVNRDRETRRDESRPSRDVINHKVSINVLGRRPSIHQSSFFSSDGGQFTTSAHRVLNILTQKALFELGLIGPLDLPGLATCVPWYVFCNLTFNSNVYFLGGKKKTTSGTVFLLKKN